MIMSSYQVNEIESGVATMIENGLDSFLYQEPVAQRSSSSSRRSSSSRSRRSSSRSSRSHSHRRSSSHSSSSFAVNVRWRWNFLQSSSRSHRSSSSSRRSSSSSSRYRRSSSSSRRSSSSSSSSSDPRRGGRGRGSSSVRNRGSQRGLFENGNMVEFRRFLS